MPGCPTTRLVLVIDGRKTLFFRNEGDQNQIDLRTEAHDERADAADHEMRTDPQSSNAQSGGFGRLDLRRNRLPPAGGGLLGGGRGRANQQSASSIMTSRRWRSSPRPRRSASSARSSTTKRPSGSSVEFLRK